MRLRTAGYSAAVSLLVAFAAHRANAVDAADADACAHVPEVQISCTFTCDENFMREIGRIAKARGVRVNFGSLMRATNFRKDGARVLSRIPEALGEVDAFISQGGKD